MIHPSGFCPLPASYQKMFDQGSLTGVHMSQDPDGILLHLTITFCIYCWAVSSPDSPEGFSSEVSSELSSFFSSVASEVSSDVSSDFSS